MATVLTVANDTAYQLVSTTDCLFQNISSYPVRVIFSPTQPEVTATNYHPITSGQGLTKQGGLPADNIYVLNHIVGRNATVVVSA